MKQEAIVDSLADSLGSRILRLRRDRAEKYLRPARLSKDGSPWRVARVARPATPTRTKLILSSVELMERVGVAINIEVVIAVFLGNLIHPRRWGY